MDFGAAIKMSVAPSVSGFGSDQEGEAGLPKKGDVRRGGTPTRAKTSHANAGSF